MSGFTQQAFEKKLSELNSSQQSIQTLSLWLIHHRKHYKVIVQTWFNWLKKAKSSRRLTCMYLANDVIQNSKKKGPEFAKEFLNVLKSAFQCISKETDAPTSALDRLVKIWEERNVYDKSHIKTFRQALHPNDKVEAVKENTNSNASNSTKDSKPTKKRENDDSKDNGHFNKKLITEQFDSTNLNNVMSKIDNNSSIDIENYEKVEPEKLVKSLKDLEGCASADVSVRTKIANLPSEVFDTKLIENVINKESAERWNNLVEEAQNMLTSYNSRLAQELEDRKQLSTMLAYFIEGQRRALTQAEQSLNEYRDKLRKVVSVREELKSHLQNLPDLSQLPSVTPLPSALDLFKL